MAKSNISRHLRTQIFSLQGAVVTLKGEIMPVSIRKTDGDYRVSTPHGVKAKHTTKAKAERQRNLLNAVEHGWKPTGESVTAQAQELVDQLLAEE